MKLYVFSRRELISPWVLAAGLMGFAIARSEWLALVGLPLIYLGWCGCAPNMNLANGCLPVLASGITLGLAATNGSADLLVAAGAGGLAWLTSSFESAWRCRPEEWPPAREEEQFPSEDRAK